MIIEEGKDFILMDEVIHIRYWVYSRAQLEQQMKN